MRIYFDFNINHRSLVCHEIAKYWKEHYGISDFAGMVAVKNGYHLDRLKNQKEIKYHSIDNRDIIEEEALKIKLDLDRINEIEKKLNIPLWHIVVADRNIGHFFVKGAVYPRTQMMSLASHENVMKWVIHYYDVLEKRLDQFKPDAVVFLSSASLPSLMLAKICEMKNIPYYELVTARVKNLYSIVKNNYKGINDNTMKDFESIINSSNPSEMISQYAKEYVESFNRNPKSPEDDAFIRRESEKVARQGILKIINQTIVGFIRMIGGYGISIFFEKPYLRKPSRLLIFLIGVRNKLNLRYALKKKFYDDIKLEDKYVLLPLHLNPEASTMIMAPNFVNQLTLIEILAKNIPLTYKLYVKEHFIGVGTRPRNFYKEIRKYPNVKLINPLADTFSLIKRASLVTTIAGTAGFEAALMGVPAITFSETFYTKAGLATYCPDIDKLGGMIKKKIWENEGINKEGKDLRIKALVTAIHKNSFEVDANAVLWNKGVKIENVLNDNREDLNKIAENFYKAFKK